jgi:hypothetical protein
MRWNCGLRAEIGQSTTAGQQLLNGGTCSAGDKLGEKLWNGQEFQEKAGKR